MTVDEYVPGCAGKVQFAARSVAAKVADRKRGREPYRCRHCGLWHVGASKWRPNVTRGRPPPDPPPIDLDDLQTT